MIKLFDKRANSFLLSLTLLNRVGTTGPKWTKHLAKVHFSTQTDPKEDNCYDIVINGGGIVGFSTLLALKRSPFLSDKKIRLLERQSKPKDTKIETNDKVFSNRVSSITKSSKKFFDSIGVWSELRQYAKPIKEFYVWSHKYNNGINFRSDNEIDESVSQDIDIMCYVIENNRMLSSLQSAVNELDQSVCYDTVVTDITSDSNCVKIQTKCLKSDETTDIKTRLLIGCDGFQSIVRQKSNLEVFEHDLQQFGIVGTVALEAGEVNNMNEIAFQRFVPFDRSVVALLPLTEDFSSFVWSVPKDSAKQLMEMSENQFIEHMNDSLILESSPSSPDSVTARLDDLMSRLLPKEMFDQQMTGYSVPHVMSLIPDSRAIFPLNFSTTVPYLVGSPSDTKDNNRLVIIGDAAHRVHPLAGQGLNLGIGDAKELSASLHGHLSRGESLFGQNTSDFKQLEVCLFEFERSRQIKLVPMLAAIHTMQELFTSVPTQMLSAFNSLEFLKKQIVRFANNS